jgi:hypothetical protein
MMPDPFRANVPEWATTTAHGWATVDDYGSLVFVPYSILFAFWSH